MQKLVINLRYEFLYGVKPHVLITTLDLHGMTLPSFNDLIVESIHHGLESMRDNDFGYLNDLLHDVFIERLGIEHLDLIRIISNVEYSFERLYRILPITPLELQLISSKDDHVIMLANGTDRC